MLNKDYLEYFKKGETENPEYWGRFNHEPNFKGLKILDIGCGHGSLCCYMGQRGAKKVIGIDINKKYINFANKNVETNFPQLKGTVMFYSTELSNLNTSDFDLIVSKDTFEHILNLNEVMLGMKKRLKKGGKIYIGFSPLYYGFNGDHGYYNIPIPWGHVIRDYFKKESFKGDGEKLSLNKWPFHEYNSLFKNSGLKICFLEYNQGRSLFLKLFNLLRRLPKLEEYFTYNLYCILKKE